MLETEGDLLSHSLLYLGPGTPVDCVPAIQASITSFRAQSCAQGARSCPHPMAWEPIASPPRDLALGEELDFFPVILKLSALRIWGE